MKTGSILNGFINLYPLWIILSSLIGFLYPPVFSWFSGNWMVGALAIVMLGMGITLKVDDFLALLKMKKAVLLGAVLQYTVMPIAALTVGRLLELPTELAVGFIIVGCCPGGTASNVITYLGRGHLALSIIMTTVSTVFAIFFTPVLCDFLAGKYIPVDAWGMFITTVKVILLPVGLGVFLNYKYPNQVQKVSKAGPLASVLAIVFIAGSIVAQSAGMVAANAAKLFLGAGLLHIIGFTLGYLFTVLLRYDSKIARTVSIEVGMQNGGLAAVLAKQNFPLQPLAAVPAVFSSVMQTLIGGLLAAFWRWKYKKEDQENITNNETPASGLENVKLVEQSKVNV